MSTKIKVEMKPVNTIVNRLGVGKRGDVQLFLTNTVNRRITQYMPYRTGALATKSKYIKSPTEIEVVSLYARYMYYGEVMVDPVTGAAGFRDKDGQWKSRKNVAKVRSGRPINYHRPSDGKGGAGHPLAGPFWDRALMAAEGKQIAAEVQDYVNRKAGKK